MVVFEIRPIFTLRYYDFCALVPIIIGAGGYMVDWQGEPLCLKSDGRVIAAGGQALVEAVRNLLKN